MKVQTCLQPEDCRVNWKDGERDNGSRKERGMVEGKERGRDSLSREDFFCALDACLYV